MVSVGLVVEGVYDEAALAEFARKCVSPEVKIVCRPCGNAFQLMKKFPGFFEDFRHVNQGSPVDKAIVIRDADQQNPSELIARMEDRITGRNYPFPRKILVIVEELEAWLLADERAVSDITKKRQAVIRRPEEIVDPKARLKTILSDARIVYTHEVARTIAAAADVDVIESRCPWFRRFRQSLID